MDSALVTVKSRSDYVKISSEPAVVSAIDCICTKISQLQHPSVLGWQEEWYIRDCTNLPPT